MCHSVKVLALVMILAKTKSESTEDQQSYTYNSFYAPSTLNFNDIYTNHLPTATEDDPTSTTEDETHINLVQTQFVEFHPAMTTEAPTIPPPKYILNSTFLMETSPAPITSSTTEDPEYTIKVVPIEKHYQRGLLDLLFPPRRVKSFKNVFDSIKRVLSHTFRR